MVGIRFIETKPDGERDIEKVIGVPDNINNLMTYEGEITKKCRDGKTYTKFTEFYEDPYSENKCLCGGRSFPAIYFNSRVLGLWIREVQKWIIIYFRLDDRRFPWLHENFIDLKGPFKPTEEQQQVINEILERKKITIEQLNSVE